MAACSTSTSPLGGARSVPTAPPAPSPAQSALAPDLPPVTPVRWTSCGSGFQCGTVNVPLDYATGSGPALTLAVIRRPASHPGPASRRGTVVVDFGGPALSGVGTLKAAAGLLPKQLLDQFDIVSFDPRGTGKSGALTCESAASVSAAVGARPIAAAGAALPVSAVYRELHTACQKAQPAQLASISSTVEARDLDRIRQAIGVQQIRYLGLSYGTVLGLAYARLFPQGYSAMVLDSPLDPSQPIAELAQQQAAAAESALQRAFQGALTAVGQRFDRLEARLRGRSLPAPGGADATPVSVGDLEMATLTYLQTPALEPQYPAAITSALAGDGKSLRTLAASQYQDLDGSPILGAYWATICGDTSERPSPQAGNSLSRRLAARYPRLGGIAYAFAGGACTVWPASSNPVTLPTEGLSRIALVGGTGDPIDPYTVAQRLTRELAGSVLITRVGEGHTSLAGSGTDSCLASAESHFLTNPAAVRTALRCTDPASK